MLSATMPPIAVYLGASLVNRIAEARLHAIRFSDMVPILIGLWLTTAIQRAVGAYMGYGRNLFVRRVQLEAERRLLTQAAKVDIGHFDNSDWHDRLARAKRDVSWRPGDLTLVRPRPLRQHRHHRADGDDPRAACTTSWSSWRSRRRFSRSRSSGG